MVRVSHTPKMPTSRKLAMVSRLLANLSIQISHQPPGGSCERIGSNAPLTRRHKPDKQVTNGVVGSKSRRVMSIFPGPNPLFARGGEEPYGPLIYKDRLPGPVRRS